MKKLALLLAIVTLLGVFSGCAARDEESSESEVMFNSPEPISENLRNQITEAFEKTFNKTCPTWFSMKNYGGGISYLGSYNGYAIVLYNQNNMIDTPYQYSMKINGEVEFKYLNSGARLYAYKDGEFTNLPEAYDKGYVTRQDLITAANAHARSIEEVSQIKKEESENISLQPDMIPDDPWFDSKIINAYCDYTNSGSVKDQLRVRYFVRFGDLYAVYVDGPMMYTDNIRGVTLYNKYRFTFPNGQKMYLFRNNQICTLDDSETEAFATIEEIDALWRYYNENVGDRYGDNVVAK